MITMQYYINQRWEIEAEKGKRYAGEHPLENHQGCDIDMSSSLTTNAMPTNEESTNNNNENDDTSSFLVGDKAIKAIMF